MIQFVGEQPCRKHLPRGGSICGCPSDYRPIALEGKTVYIGEQSVDRPCPSTLRIDVQVIKVSARDPRSGRPAPGDGLALWAYRLRCRCRWSQLRRVPRRFVHGGSSSRSSSDGRLMSATRRSCRPAKQSCPGGKLIHANVANLPHRCHRHSPRSSMETKLARYPRAMTMALGIHPVAAGPQ